MEKYDLYTASYAGILYGNGADKGEYRMVIITKWKDRNFAKI